MPDPYGMAFFCEDIRQEIEGKTSYMGIFGANITLVGERPATLPKLCVAAHINIPSSWHMPHVRIVVFRVTEGSEEEISSVDGEVATPEDRPVADDLFTRLVAINFLVPFKVHEDCELVVRAFINKDTGLNLGAIPINFIGE